MKILIWFNFLCINVPLFLIYYRSGKLFHLQKRPTAKSRWQDRKQNFEFQTEKTEDGSERGRTLQTSESNSGRRHVFQSDCSRSFWMVIIEPRALVRSAWKVEGQFAGQEEIPSKCRFIANVVLQIPALQERSWISIGEQHFSFKIINL